MSRLSRIGSRRTSSFAGTRWILSRGGLFTVVVFTVVLVVMGSRRCWRLCALLRRWLMLSRMAGTRMVSRWVGRGGLWGLRRCRWGRGLRNRRWRRRKRRRVGGGAHRVGARYLVAR